MADAGAAAALRHFTLRKLMKERFLAKVLQGPNCWEWQAAKDDHGYGRFNNGTGMKLAHRISWELHKGPIPDGLQVLHTCNNSSCVNPKHLYLGTHADNMKDLARVGNNRLQKINFEVARQMRRKGATLTRIASHFKESMQAVKQGLERNYGTSSF